MQNGWRDYKQQMMAGAANDKQYSWKKNKKRARRKKDGPK